MKTISLVNNKGGVGKSTIALNLAKGLSMKGEKVLAIDLDPQGNFSLSMGLKDLGAVDILSILTTLETWEPGEHLTLNLKYTSADIFTKSCEVEDAVIPVNENLDLLPFGFELGSMEFSLHGMGREVILREALKKVSDRYSYCIIDCPPSLGILTINALAASNFVFAPMLTEAYSLQALYDMVHCIRSAQEYFNPDLVLGGLIMNMYDPRTTLSKTIENFLYALSPVINTHVLSTHIRPTVKIKESSLSQMSVLEYAPKSPVADDMRALVDEIYGITADAKPKKRRK